MNYFEQIEGQILQTIYQLYLHNDITLIEKGILKDYLISKQSSKFNMGVASYYRTHNLEQLIAFLKDFPQYDQSCADVDSVSSSRTVKSYKKVKNESEMTFETRNTCDTQREQTKSIRSQRRFMTQKLL
ncbi:hypothetical protein pb186bvf_007052 [Paramecium bursaria]